LKQGEQRFSGGAGRRTRTWLVVSEVALALVLLIGAGLLTQSFATLASWEPGFEQENLLTVWLLASSGKYAEGDQVADLFGRAVDEVRSVPGIVSVGMTSSGPMFGGIEPDAFWIGGRPAPPPGQEPVANWHDIGPGYFRTLGLPLRAGRSFSDADTRGTPSVAIVNEALARRYFSGVDPLGQQVTLRGRTMTIVGVVADVRPFRPGEPVTPEVYWPYRQAPRWATYVVLRTGLDPASVVRPVRERLRALDADLQISSFTTMEQRVGRHLVSPRFNMFLIVVFATVALTLAAIGIYGVLSYSVAQRTHEIGIRVALGAHPRDILKTVVGRGMLPTLGGIALGLVGAFALTRALTSMLFGIEATDPLTYSGIALLLAVVGLLACLLPARRATRVDPMAALRHE